MGGKIFGGGGLVLVPARATHCWHGNCSGDRVYGLGLTLKARPLLSEALPPGCTVVDDA